MRELNIRRNSAFDVVASAASMIVMLVIGAALVRVGLALYAALAPLR